MAIRDDVDQPEEIETAVNWKSLNGDVLRMVFSHYISARDDCELGGRLDPSGPAGCHWHNHVETAAEECRASRAG